VVARFCFFTGSDGGMDTLHRTQSASSVEEFLSTTSPRIHAFPQHFLTTPTRSPGLDDTIKCRSGSSTPTALDSVASESRSATPVAAN